MKSSTFLIVSAAALGLSLGGLAGAEEDKRTTAKPTAPTIKRAGAPQSQGTPSAAPLKGEIRLAPAGQRGAAAHRLARQITFEKIKKQFAELSGNAQEYEMGVSLMPAIAKACASSSKAWSVDEQKAAGCTGNDSMNQCMDKLYKYCLENFSVGGLQFPAPVVGGGQLPVHSTKQFKEAAEKAAAQARALSQALSQYEKQTEQNAKAFSP